MSMPAEASDSSPAAAVPAREVGHCLPLASGSAEKSAGAFELKFVVDTACSRQIEDWARQHLAPDAHADPALVDGYHVNNLYLDTPDLQTYHRLGFFKRRKFRLRRYGSESTVYLELKHKREGRVRKRRLPVTEAQLHERLLAAGAPWEGDWFRSHLEQQRLQPVCQLTYQRFVRVAETANGPLRLTIDSQLRARPAADWQIPAGPLDTACLLGQRRIVEFKFHETLPALFRELIYDLRLPLSAYSKYRTAVAASLSLGRGDSIRSTS